MRKLFALLAASLMATPALAQDTPAYTDQPSRQRVTAWRGNGTIADTVQDAGNGNVAETIQSGGAGNRAIIRQSGNGDNSFDHPEWLQPASRELADGQRSRRRHHPAGGGGRHSGPAIRRRSRWCDRRPRLARATSRSARLAALLAVLACLPAQAQQTLPGSSAAFRRWPVAPAMSTVACQQLRQALPGQSLPEVVARPTAPPPLAMPAPPRADYDDTRSRPAHSTQHHGPAERSAGRSRGAGLPDRHRRQAVRRMDHASPGDRHRGGTQPDGPQHQHVSACRKSLVSWVSTLPACSSRSSGTDGENAVTEFDPRNRFRRGYCTTLSRQSRVEVQSVLVQDLLTCQDQR